MYRPTPIEMYNYDEYKEYIKNMINEIEEDNKKDKELIRKNLELYKDDPESVSYVSDDGINCRRVENKNIDYLVDIVGISYRVFLRKKQYKDLLDELDFLNTDEGKEAYINKMGRYSNIELL